MILTLKQTKKEKYRADFMIYRGQKAVGAVTVQVQTEEKALRFSGVFLERGFLGEGTSAEKEDFRFRLGASRSGTVREVREKAGLLRHSFLRLDVDGLLYEMYPIGFGREGARNPVYHCGRQVAQIDTPPLLSGSMHSYTLFAQEENSAVIALLCSLYCYASRCFKPGSEAHFSKFRSGIPLPDPFYRQKYDPEFLKYIEK